MELCDTEDIEEKKICQDLATPKILVTRITSMLVWVPSKNLLTKGERE